MLPSFTTYFTLLLVIVYVYAVYGTAYLSGQVCIFGFSSLFEGPGKPNDVSSVQDALVLTE